MCLEGNLWLWCILEKRERKSLSSSWVK
jgi:hypothetical protein